VKNQHDSIKSHLYLHAVIPALEMLVRIDPESRSLAAGLKKPLRLLVGCHEQLTLSMEEEGLRCHRKPVSCGAFTLWFPTDTQFLKLVENKGLPLVLPRSGWLSIATLRSFSLLMKRLEWYLKPVDPGTVSPHELACRVHLQLAVATASVPVLGLLDDLSQRELLHLPSGVALFSCDPTLPPCWVRVDQGRAVSGIGDPPEIPLVELTFTDPYTGYEALAERLDQLAAVHTGKIRVKGLVPMADGLDLVLGRVSKYLPTS
jgi:hypothetical protein